MLCKSVEVEAFIGVVARSDDWTVVCFGIFNGKNKLDGEFSNIEAEVVGSLLIGVVAVEPNAKN